MAYVTYEKRDHVAIITLNRPERMNALGRALSAELREAEAEFIGDDDVWIGIYTGAGDRAFCAGRDLKEAAEQEAGEKASPSAATTGPISRFERIAADHGKPTIAAINGAAYGGGLEKALTCDIRICSENARMALAEVKVGLCPPGGSFNLPRHGGVVQCHVAVAFGRACRRGGSVAHGLGHARRAVSGALGHRRRNGRDHRRKRAAGGARDTETRTFGLGNAPRLRGAWARC